MWSSRQSPPKRIHRLVHFGDLQHTAVYSVNNTFIRDHTRALCAFCCGRTQHIGGMSSSMVSMIHFTFSFPVLRGLLYVMNTCYMTIHWPRTVIYRAMLLSFFKCKDADLFFLDIRSISSFASLSMEILLGHAFFLRPGSHQTQFCLHK